MVVPTEGEVGYTELVVSLNVVGIKPEDFAVRHHGIMQTVAMEIAPAKVEIDIGPEGGTSELIPDRWGWLF